MKTNNDFFFFLMIYFGFLLIHQSQIDYQLRGLANTVITFGTALNSEYKMETLIQPCFRTKSQKHTYNAITSEQE